MAKKFLSFLPSNSNQTPPVAPVPPGSGEKMASILVYLPESRQRTYHMRRINTMHLGGSLDADALDKSCSFLVLCDSFNIPIIMAVDTPGFLIGRDGEWREITGKIINFMNALLGMPQICSQEIGGNNRLDLGMDVFTSGTGEETTRKPWCSRRMPRLSNGESTDFRLL